MEKETRLVTKKMIEKVKTAMDNVEPDSDIYFYFDDFLRVCQGATEIFISKEHFKHVGFLF